MLELDGVSGEINPSKRITMFLFFSFFSSVFKKSLNKKSEENAKIFIYHTNTT